MGTAELITLLPGTVNEEAPCFSLIQGLSCCICGLQPARWGENRWVKYYLNRWYLTNGSLWKEALICSLCQWCLCKYSRHGWFEAVNIRPQNEKLGRSVPNFVSQSELIPAHPWGGGGGGDGVWHLWGKISMSSMYREVEIIMQW